MYTNSQWMQHLSTAFKRPLKPMKMKPVKQIEPLIRLSLWGSIFEDC